MQNKTETAPLTRRFALWIGGAFGFGFLFGFLVGYGYLSFDRRDVVAQPAAPPPLAAVSADRAAERIQISADLQMDATALHEMAPQEIGLVLEEHSLEEDDNGLYISGTIHNRSGSTFDAVLVVFDLCDAAGRAYTAVTDRLSERMDPGDTWGFAIYIPYSEMSLFSSYRLQSIMGVRR